MKHYGDGLFDDPLAHLPEHSIELEVRARSSTCSRAAGRSASCRCWSARSHDCVHGRSDPAEADDIARMVAALRQAEAAAGEPVCYVISGDLAHIGPKFGDPRPVSEPQLAASRAQDEADPQPARRPPTRPGTSGSIAAEEDAPATSAGCRRRG